MLDMNASNAQVELLREQMWLNRPVLLRYVDWSRGLLSFNFGKSYTYSMPVIDLIRERLVVSFPLTVIALTLSALIAIPVKLFAAARRGKTGNTVDMAAVQVGVAPPNFWFALLLLYIFAVWLGLVPAGGFPR